ncbi:hypothetical protein [Paraburkholderia youngii]|uniref:hypothetical protein n=1 Tax=Paraburkholderia youngii TaxID=2782701 RepID=UPI003D26149C
MGRRRKEDRADPRVVPGAPDRDWLERWHGFDFAAHFAAVDRGEKPDDDHVMMLLLYSVQQGPDTPMWVRAEINDRFMAVLSEGVTWEVAFPLPWLPEPTADEIHTADELRRYDIAGEVYALVMTRGPAGNPDDKPLGIDEAIDQVAGRRDLSVRTVERAWKELRERLGIPPGADRK